MGSSHDRVRGCGHWLGATALLISLVALSIAVSAQTTQLRLVSTAWSPFTNEPGRPRFALDLVEAGFGRIGVKTSTTIVDAAQFTTSLLSGKFDGSAAAWKDAERERTLLFSQPYLENRLILVARRGGDVSAATLAALKGKRIAIVEGYSYGETIDQSGATFVRSRTDEDSLRLLLDSKVDYTLMDELVVQYIVSNYAEEARTRLQLGSTPLLTRPLYLAREADVAGCRVDRQPLQRPTPRHGCGSYLPSPPAPGLDPGRHRRRWSRRVRAAERSPGCARAQARV